jgi:phosphoglycerate dehydrogenase-like enzyme
MAGKILVTPRSVTRDGHPSLLRLTQAGFDVICCTPGKQPSEDELLRLLPGCVGYLCGVEKVPARMLAAAPQLQVISRNGTGIDNIDLTAARRQNVRVCRAEGANARGVAELTLALMLALARSVPFCDQAIKSGGWERRLGTELEGRALGLVGCGKIGKLVARFALALDMDVLACDPLPDPAFRPSPRFHYAPLEQLWPASDFLSLHCPPSPNGQPLITREVLERTRKGLFIVNTARAELIDEPAALAALDSGRLAGLATDVFATEPPPQRQLAGHPRVIATSHIGGFTQESVTRSMDVAVDNLLAALARAPSP